MSTRRKGKNVMLGATTIALLLTGGCAESTFQKKINETEKENQVLQENKPTDLVTEDTAPSEIKLSEEQQAILDDLGENTVEEALAENHLEERNELDIAVPDEKAAYEDVEELSQFMSYYFYMYHTNQIDAREFYNKVSPHFDSEFIELLPSTKKKRIEMFETLQETFTSHLPSKIVKYAVSESNSDPRKDVVTFYRMYELENGKQLFYMTILQKIENQWLLVDDSPAPGYVITKSIQDDLKVKEKEESVPDAK